MRFLTAILRVAITLGMVAIAVILGIQLWRVYMLAPWTRDGRVRVYVVDIAPQVSGRVVAVPVHDNQFIHKGDLLYQLDPTPYRLAVQRAAAALAEAQAQFNNRLSDVRRRMGLTGVVSAEEQEQYRTTAAVAGASLDAARAQLGTAQYNLSQTTLLSPVNGFVTNLQLRVGDYANTGQARIAVIDSDSFYIYGYFEETKLYRIHPGDHARIKLMGYSALLDGHVDSITRGINDQNQAIDQLGLPEVNPVFTWVRLAQRIPVRIHIDDVPTGIVLAAGETCSISIGPGGALSGTATGRLVRWLEDHL